jgi:hypothetical protein
VLKRVRDFPLVELILAAALAFLLVRWLLY